ncbi:MULTISPECIES: 3-deoxy-D-manno-octulosonic acid transferase [unclassified Acidiphilium]|uniref:3-deoxy-D-manno-octulosonic acid transferase n=1 Tax=unclassified Acidiphilium TaxID=2617493 RepID=UPI000BD1ABE5|nr:MULTISPECIES: glycosyltransferase N-terminal domain-containing protein [unclassified Acidiphilium]OYV55964.1 MAG: 3-deoxy-D-manno-octulosonic acid transferase [Acidiphilium sp. 20-67-58]HQT61558.1 glycosyltransferase N-terminal domain-containing protein [Acidiphilium sp.]
MPPALTAYRLATAAIAPLLPLWLARRARRGKEIAARLPERHGIAGIARPPGRLVWVHAASMGETMSALGMIDALADGAPDDRATVLLTTGTRTAAALAQSRARALHQFVPLDVAAHAARFLDHWRPDAAVFLESEIWPNLLAGLDARRIPRFLFNARLSARSAARWRRAPRLARALFGGFQLIAAQSAPDADALRGLGLTRVETWGNLKFAAPDLPDDPAARAALAAAAAGPFILAASTHPGEDAPVIAAHRILRATRPGLVTIIAPRHPERAAAIAGLAGDLPVSRRSRGEAPAAGGLYLADTLGELGLFYRLAAVSFIGGSLVPIGGHNMIEAAQLGCPVLTGPHLTNFAEAAATLRAAGALADLAGPDDLAPAIATLLDDPARRAAMAAAGRAACAGLADLPARLAHIVLARTVPDKAP